MVGCSIEIPIPADWLTFNDGMDNLLDAKVNLELSDNTPLEPAKTTLVLVNPSAVKVAALKSWAPISKSPPAVNDVIPSIVPPLISAVSATNESMLAVPSILCIVEP